MYSMLLLYQKVLSYQQLLKIVTYGNPKTLHWN